ncbi:MAG: hypothetical protein F6K62_20565 [Sphaerospermopsis sp. SIO1G2]|nr:hypothetical protein [Sphaerospermopsis sp. SIO1G1]NET73237.1 hypothetical protein [Sphaerospermopsis sp. SIO1G2]
MNITKLIFLACHVVLASLLFVVNPAQASTKSQVAQHSAQVVALSVQAIPPLTTPIFNQKQHKINSHFGCSCSNCVSRNFSVLQGKLPVVDF